ncbi:MAG: LysM peptidoglycan-binding domain-containing protein, partial [Firmicutes bacterium]|nr:LysM peptidoglycan-binding domain-containing protein [Bacillota bacterium]
GLDIVGWAYIQPGYEDTIKAGIRDFQRENDGFRVMFLIDPAEKINSFFVWQDDEFKALKGYIIYYEKNEGMHEYMLENKLKPTNDDYKLISDISLPPAEGVEGNFDAEREQSEDRRALRLKRREDKKAAGLMSTLSFVMLMVCFVMGAGLVQNDKRINRLELDIASLESELEAADGAQSVFAAEYVSVTPVEEDETTTFIPETEAPTEPPTEAFEEETKAPYKVEKGDTLSRISEKVYGTIGRMEDIMQLNGMDDADSLVEGMELVLPE